MYTYDVENDISIFDGDFEGLVYMTLRMSY